VTYACGDYFDEAIADLSRSLEREPQQPNVLYSRGNLLYALGEIKAALDDYERAFRLEADMNRIDLSDEYGLYGRGLAYWNMGDKATAFSDLQAALQVSRRHHNLASGAAGAPVSAATERSRLGSCAICLAGFD
jgi:tetratricopeptide (TPR) repeat protein